MWPSANSAGIIAPRLESPAWGDIGYLPGPYVAPEGLRSKGSAPPTAVAVGQTMSALTGLAWQEYFTVFTNQEYLVTVKWNYFQRHRGFQQIALYFQ
jgi:hypothetical protein